MTGELADYWVYPLRWGETVADQDWVPFYFHRFLGSDFLAQAYAGGDLGRAAGFAALHLWCEAIKQDPAGTLPDNDVSLARAAGFAADVDGWLRVRKLALHGWTPCHIEDDGTRGAATRLGHRTIAEIAVYAWNRKHGRKLGREAARLSQVKWKVRQQMEKAKRPARLLSDDMLVTRIAEWLIRSGLTITQENVASGLAWAGVPKVVAFRGEDKDG